MVVNNDVFHALLSSEQLKAGFPKTTNLIIDVKTFQHLSKVPVGTSKYTIVKSAQSPFNFVYFVFEILLSSHQHDVRSLNDSVYYFLPTARRSLLRYPNPNNRKPEYSIKEKSQILVCLLGNKRFLSESGFLFLFYQKGPTKELSINRFSKIP
jgi:hypothetical protein